MEVNLDSEAGKSISSTLYDFFSALNDERYDQVLSFLNPDFVQQNNLTTDMVRDYFQNEYPHLIAYKLDSAFQEKPGIYHVKIMISNQNPNDNTYYYVYDSGANYYFQQIGKEYKISIPHMIIK